jgi:hypothetical protein
MKTHEFLKISFGQTGLGDLFFVQGRNLTEIQAPFG